MNTENSGGKSIWRRLLIVPPILIGVAIVATIVKNREGPVQDPVQEIARAVRIITVPEITVIPRALGFGTVRPGKVWDAIAEISGQIVYAHPHFKAGAILAKDTVLLRIDDTDYRLKVGEVEADIRALRAGLKELGARRQNALASLAIENKAFAIAEGEVKRKRALLTRRAVSQAAVDLEERNLLARRQSVQGLKNSLNLLPAETERLNAQLAAMRIKLESARRDLDRTTIRLPFDARLAETKIEHAQFAKSGQVLAIADSIDVAEISAQIQVDKLLQLINPTRLATVNPLNASGNLDELLGLTPIVRLKIGSLVAVWKGRVARVSDRVDPRTRTVGVIVAVDDPYKLGGDPFRPPLAKNMYVEVELRGRARDKQIVVPRAALHDGRVYVAGADNRLKIKKFTVQYMVGDLAVIKSGVSAGDRIVVSDLIPAIDGMLLSLIHDTDLEKSVARAAKGEGGLR